MNLAPHAEAIARALLGEPNKRQSTKAQLRFGSKGALAVEIAGAKAGTWYDHEAKAGGGMLALVRREKGFDNGAVFQWLADELGIEDPPKPKWTTTGRWTYRDRDGNPLFRVVRRDCPGAEKRIHFERYDAATGKFARGKDCMDGIPRVPFRLNEWIDVEGPVLLPEGERKVARLFDLGWLATCNAGGSKNFPKGFAPYLQGRDVVLLPDNDDAGRNHARKVASILEPVAASIRVLELPGLPPKGDVVDWLEAGGTAEQLKAMLEAAPPAADVIATWPDPEPEPPSGRCPYSATAAGIFWAKKTADGSVDVPLTNFNAAIVGEIERDDGAERTLRFEIEAKLEGRRHRFEIGSAEFAGLSWATRELGARALVYPGFAIKDHARAAIQMLSPVVARRRVFGHLGWREVDGKVVYLHAGGAIDATGLRQDVETDLGDMELFELPAPGDPKASLQLLDLGPLEVTAPVFATIWRAPIEPADFTLHESGPTGVFKSELAALAQQHFGTGLDARHLASWSSTANSLEARAFAAKDALLVVDDFAPAGAASDVQRMQREAARLVRAQGNRAGRGRMRPDGTLRPTKPPRCTILSTGEDIPAGQSIRARLFVVEIGHGDIDQAALTRAQRDAHRFAGAMAAYVRHLARDLEGHRRRFRDRSAELRAEAQGGHKRTAWIVGELGAALELYLRFVDRLDLWSECWRALKAASGAQAAHQLSEDPARRFVALVGALLSSKTAHLGRADDPDAAPFDHVAGEVGWLQVVPEREGQHGDDDHQAVWKPQGPRIGWCDRDGETAFLEPEAAYSAAQRLATSQGQLIGVGSRTLWKRLGEAGLLAMRDGDRNTYKTRIGGPTRNVVAISIATLNVSYTPQETGTAGTSGTEAENPKETAGPVPDNCSRFSSDGGLSGTKNGNKPEANRGFEAPCSRSSRSSRFSDHYTGATFDRPEHEGQPWADDDDPAEYHNWAPEEPSIAGARESGTAGTCEQPGCGQPACLTGPEGCWCVNHLEVWQRRAVCAHCGQPIETGEGSAEIQGGAVLHNRCADAWARA
jgi:hypothetical protein